jgi:hypothetical protein
VVVIQFAEFGESFTAKWTKVCIVWILVVVDVRSKYVVSFWKKKKLRTSFRRFIEELKIKSKLSKLIFYKRKSIDTY